MKAAGCYPTTQSWQTSTPTTGDTSIVQAPRHSVQDACFLTVMGFAVVKRAENLYGLPACLNGLEPAPSPDYPRVGPLHHENHGVFSHGPPGFSSGYILGIRDRPSHLVFSLGQLRRNELRLGRASAHNWGL